MKLNLTDLISYIVLGAGVISFIASALAKSDKKHATLWNDVQNIADAVVAQQAVTKNSNPEKKLNATSELIKQANALGHDKIKPAVAQGAIEQAVIRHKQNKMKEKTDSEVLDDLHL